MFQDSRGPLHFAAMTDGRRILIHDAKPVKLASGTHFILHRSPVQAGYWSITEVKTGRCVSVAVSPEAAVERAQYVLASRAPRLGVLDRMIERLIPARVAPTG